MPKILAEWPRGLINYRVNTFRLFDREVSIGGMSGIHNVRFPREALLALKKHANGALCIIAMHDESKADYTNLAKREGVEFNFIDTEDFGGGGSKHFDDIYELVKTATLAGKQVVLSCGSGNGRTGAALASLKLRELLVKELEKEFEKNPSFADPEEAKASEVFVTLLPHKGAPAGTHVSCTPLVKKAIELIREERATPPGDGVNNGCDSVEVGRDIEALMSYETYLRKKLAKELAPKMAPRSTPDLTSPSQKAGESPGFFSRGAIPADNSNPSSNNRQSSASDPRKDEDGFVIKKR